MAKQNLLPPVLTKCNKNYELDKGGLLAWSDLVNKQGNLTVLPLPKKSQVINNVENRAFETFSKWEQFDDCEKLDGQTMEEFILDFEVKYSWIRVCGTELPEEALVFMLLKRSGITSAEKMLLLSLVNNEPNKSLLKEVKMHMKNSLGKKAQDTRKHTEKLCSVDSLPSEQIPWNNDGSPLLSSNSFASYGHSVPNEPASFEDDQRDQYSQRNVLLSDEFSNVTSEEIRSDNADYYTFASEENWIRHFLEPFDFNCSKVMHASLMDEKCFVGNEGTYIIHIFEYY